jgi:hypothetical protein
MKKIIITILTLTMLLFTACTPNSNVIENQDKITIERTGMYTLPEYAHNLVTINKSGIETKLSHYNGTLTKREFIEFKNNEFEQIKKILNENNFQNLNPEYNSEVLISDIGQGIITYNNKSVNINPYISRGNPTEIQNILNNITSILYGQQESPFDETITLDK